MYTQKDYMDAINFALNYPSDFKLKYIDNDNDIFVVDVFDEGWYSNIVLYGFLVRSCLKYKGEKQWI